VISTYRTSLKQTDEVIQVRSFVTEPAKVSVRMGATVNLGNMEFGRVDVSLEMPCYVEEIDSVYADVLGWVDEKLDAVVKEMEGDRKTTGSDVGGTDF